MNRRHVLFAIAVLVLLNTTVSPISAQQQVVPPSPIMVNSPIVTINSGPGDQTQPHVSNDLAAYTDVADAQIHYFRFSTSTDFIIPAGTSVSDTLSDVDGNRICFTTQTPANNFELSVFDVVTSS